MPKIKNITMDDFSGGIDRRDGLISRDARKAYDIVNMRIDQGGKPTLRPPCEQLSGSTDANTEGFTYLNGKFYTFTDQAGTITHTVSGITVNTLRFDPPPFANGTWAIVDSVVLNEVIVALIEHERTGGSSAFMLHVFDEEWSARTKPTYVLDGACPAAWSPELPSHPFGPGTVGKPRDYRPRLSVAGGRVIVTAANGDTLASAINRPRVWNQREGSDILATGWWYYLITVDSTLLEWTLPINPNDLRNPTGFASYVLEYCDTDGNWRQLSQVVGYPAGISEWSISPAASRWPGRLEPESLIRVRWGLGKDYVIRFRVLSRPAVSILNGATLLPALSITSGIVTFEAGSKVIDSKALVGLTASTWYYILYGPDGASAIEDTGGPTAFPDSVYAGNLYRNRVLYRAKVNGGGTAFDLSFTSGGTVTVSVGSSKVLGVATSFTTTLRANMRITVGGETRTVRAITSDLELEVTEPFTTAASGVGGTYDPKFDLAFEIGETGNEFYAKQEALAILSAGYGDAASISTSLHDQDDANVVCVLGTQNRLFVQFPQMLQLWSITDNPKDIAILSKHALGSGENDDPWPLMVEGWAMLPTALGVRAFSPAGNNKDYIEHLALGDKLRGIKLPSLGVSAWWQPIGCYLTCKQGAGDGTIYCLSHWRGEREIDAWSTWKVPGLTTIDGMFTAGRFLYVLSGHTVFRFDPDATSFVDTAGQIVGTYRTLYNDMDEKRTNKKVVAFDYGMTGKAQVSIYVNPSHTEEWVAGPPVIGPGYAQGRQRIAISAYGPSIAIELVVADPAGWMLEHLAYDFKMLNR